MGQYNEETQEVDDLISRVCNFDNIPIYPYPIKVFKPSRAEILNMYKKPWHIRYSKYIRRMKWLERTY